MKTAFEERLSDAFATRAASFPGRAADRLGSVDFHPRGHRFALPVALGAGAAASAATVGTVLAVVLGGAAPAYAGWSPTPTATAASTGTATTSPQASQSCQNALPSGQPSGSELGSGSWQTVLTDVRGPFTVELFQNSGAYAACFTSSDFTSVTQVAGDVGAATQAQTANGTIRSLGSASPSSGLSTLSVGGTSSGDLQNVVQTHLSTSADGPYTLVDGRVASGVTAVSLGLDSGQDVVATVSDGWLIAWWPGDAAATSAKVTTASGTSNETLQPTPGKGGPGPATPPQPGACATVNGAGNASKTSTGGPTNETVHCASSSSSTGNSGAGGTSNSGSTGAGLKSGG